MNQPLHDQFTQATIEPTPSGTPDRPSGGGPGWGSMSLRQPQISPSGVPGDGIEAQTEELAFLQLIKLGQQEIAEGKFQDMDSFFAEMDAQG